MQRSQAAWLNISVKILIVSSAIYFFSFVTADPDLWGHIKFGEDHWHQAKLIQTEPYSFTAQGKRWINHEWLAELIFYITYSGFGDAGLLIGKLGIGLTIVLLLNQICSLRTQTPLVYAIVLVLALFVISPGFMIRPQLFSFLFFILFLYLLHLYFIKKKNRLWLLPVLMIFWVNLHGGFLMGWILISAITFQSIIKWVFFKKKEPHIIVLSVCFLLTTLAMMVNPYGWKLLLFLYQTLSLPRAISEWQPVTIWDLSFLRFKLMVVIFIMSLLKNYKKSCQWEVIIILITLYASLRHQRHTPFFAISAAPYLVCQLSTWNIEIKAQYSKLRLLKASQTILIIFIGLLASFQFIQSVYRYRASNFRIIVDPDEYPIGAVRFIAHNHIKGDVLLPFTWGEYAIWKLFPECKVSIDGRFRTVYPEAVIQDHFIEDHDSKRWRALLNKYPADILLMRQIPFFQRLISKNNNWIYVYSDRTAIVFLRKNRANQSVIDKFRKGHLKYPDTALSMYFP